MKNLELHLAMSSLLLCRKCSTAHTVLWVVSGIEIFCLELSGML